MVSVALCSVWQIVGRKLQMLCLISDGSLLIWTNDFVSKARSSITLDLINSSSRPPGVIP